MNRGGPYERPSFFRLLLVTFALLGAVAAAGAEKQPPTVEERRLELERRALELKKDELQLEQKRLEIDAERKKLLEEASVREVITIQLQGEVLFDFGKAKIRPGSEPTLEKVAAVIQ